MVPDLNAAYLFPTAAYDNKNQFASDLGAVFCSPAKLRCNDIPKALQIALDARVIGKIDEIGGIGKRHFRHGFIKHRDHVRPGRVLEITG